MRSTNICRAFYLGKVEFGLPELENKIFDLKENIDTTRKEIIENAQQNQDALLLHITETFTKFVGSPNNKSAYTSQIEEAATFINERKPDSALIILDRLTERDWNGCDFEVTQTGQFRRNLVL